MYPKGISGLFDVAQRGGHDQNCQPDPEEDEEASKVPIFAVRIEMGDSWGVVNGVERTMLCLGFCLLLCSR